MQPVGQIARVSSRFYRPEQTHCLVCEKRLRRAVTLTERTVIPQEGVIKLAQTVIDATLPNKRKVRLNVRQTKVLHP